jgi:hypothetical protein
MMRKIKLLFLVLMCVVSFHVRAQEKKPVVIEVIMKSELSKNRFFYYAKEYGITDVKLWKNRLVIYAQTANSEQLKKYIGKYYPKDEIIVFDKPFYDFNRKYCNDKKVASQWDNIILSANLVADPKLQQEYLNYHKTQLETWPEVSQGFCNASFQQLLVFRNGRQLMLIISIPKGESLDKLNPLTTKDNPRVDEWNKIMAKYQEGIEGTAKGETWVFFKNYTQ